MTFSADFSEVTSLAADLGKAPLRIVKQAGEVVEKTTNDAARDAKAGIHDVTGRLSKSFVTEVRGLTGVTGPTLFYGKYLEEGTSKMGPQPYLAPAQDKNTPPFVDAIGDLSKGILG